MIYVVGTIGFIGGFVLGQMILLRLLKDRSKDELITDKSLGWTYGLLNWVMAIGGAASAVSIYNKYFF